MVTFDKTKPNQKLATNRYDFENHINGTDFRHDATQTDLNPDLVIDATTATTVQEALTALKTSITSYRVTVVGDGYDTWVNSLTSPSSPYDGYVPYFSDYLNDILNNSANPLYFQIRLGGIVIIKAGTYKFNSTVNVPAGIIIQGEGYGTKIVNQMSTPTPLFRIKADSTRIADKSIENTNPFVFSKWTGLENITICDNFPEPKYLGDTDYKLPINITEANPLVIQEPGSYLFCNKVTFLGRVQYASPSTLTAVTSMPISVDGTLPVSTGTILSVDNCFIDGFSQAIKFVTTTSGTVTTASQDYLFVTNNKVRVYGYLNSSAIVNDYPNNIFFRFNACNADISHNYIYGNDVGYAQGLVYIPLFQTSGLTASGFPRVKITNNFGGINKSGPFVSNELVHYLGTIANLYFDISQNSINTTTIEFADSNTLNHSINKIRLTSDTSTDGDYGVRVAETAADTNTLLKSINGRPTVSVGNGSSSFGDFNGNTALASAITALTPLDGGVIYVKQGTYTLASALSVPTNCNFEFIGEGIDKSIIQVSTAINIMNVDGYSAVSLKKLQVKNTSGSLSQIYVDNSQLNCEDLTFDLVNIQTNNGYTTDYARSKNTLYIKNSKIVSDGYNALIIGVSGNTNTQTGYIIDDSQFICLGGKSAVKITALSAGSYQTNLQHIYFNRCGFLLTAGAVSGGAFVNNCGVLELSNGLVTSTSSFNPSIKLNDIHFIDCDTFTSGVTCSLFHVIPTNNGIDYGGASTDPYIRLDFFEINGGQFLVDAGQSHTLTPFNIVLSNFTNNYPSKISIRNTKIGFSGPSASTHGDVIPIDTDYFYSYSSPDTPGFMNLIANEVNIENVNMQYLTQLSTSGDLFVDAKYIDINNVKLKDYVTAGPDTVPLKRVYINGGGTIKNLTIEGTTSANASDWGGNTILEINQKVQDPSGIVSTHPLTFDGLIIRRFKYNTTSSTARCVQFKTNVAFTDKVTITNSILEDFATAGIAYIATSVKNITTLNISNNYINSSSVASYGVFISMNGSDSASKQFGSVQILGNKIYAATNGVYFRGADWNNSGGLVITGNQISAGLNPAIYIWNSESTATQAGIKATIISNDCYNTEIELVGDVNIGDGDYTTVQLPVRGCETGYNAVTTRRFTTGNGMLHNFATLTLS